MPPVSRTNDILPEKNEVGSLICVLSILDLGGPWICAWYIVVVASVMASVITVARLFKRYIILITVNKLNSGFIAVKFDYFKETNFTLPVQFSYR